MKKLILKLLKVIPLISLLFLVLIPQLAKSQTEFDLSVSQLRGDVS